MMQLGIRWVGLVTKVGRIGDKRFGLGWFLGQNDCTPCGFINPIQTFDALLAFPIFRRFIEGTCKVLDKDSAFPFKLTSYRQNHLTKRRKMSCRPKVIIDTDTGIDDAVALFMALEAHRRNLIEIVAITTVNGNTSLDNVNINVFRVLETAQMIEIPVYPGASRGLVSTFIHPGIPCYGYDGFGDVIKDGPPSSLSLLQKETAALALIRLVKENPGEVIMVAIGPLTNAAIAMNICPDWSSKLKDFYVMGGNVLGEGNITSMGEFNFVCDPEAAKVVLERTKIPIKITPWETCIHPFKISYEERGKLASVNTPSADLLNTIEESAKKFKCRKDWITCDQLVIAWLLHNYATSLFERDFPNQNFVTKVDSFHATVEISGQHTRGQMIIDHKNFVAEEQNILCMREINKDMYLQYLKLAFQ